MGHDFAVCQSFLYGFPFNYTRQQLQALFGIFHVVGLGSRNLALLW